MKMVMAVILSLFAVNVSAAENYVGGEISDITSTQEGVMVAIDGDRKIPNNCIGTPYRWMLIKQEDKAMISVMLTAWSLGKSVSVYTAPRSSGYCVITQVDPVG